MANINLTTSKNSDTYIDVELKYFKTINHKLSKVDLINFILEEIYEDKELQFIFREKVDKTLKNQINEKEERLKDIIGVIRNG